ncbi:MAG: response regulator [Lutibacter sp.]|nr:response regulator [Lutibacter sp.]
MKNKALTVKTISNVIHGLNMETSESVYLEKNIALLTEVLDCSKMVVLEKKELTYQEKYSLPKLPNTIPGWISAQQDCIVFFSKKENNSWKKILEEYTCYGYRLANYGLLIIARKKPFTPLTKEAVLPLLVLFGKQLANFRDRRLSKKMEQRLKHQEEKYQHIISNMNLGLMEIDLQGRISYCNQSFLKITGYRFEEVKQKNALALLVPKDNYKFAVEKLQERIFGMSDTYELPVKTKSGQLKWVLISASPMFDEEGNIKGSFSIHLDITESKEMARTLEKALVTAQGASKAKEGFLANMSHEIRSPLNGILGLLRLLSKESLSKKQRNYVDSSLVASRHLLSLVNNILDITKIEAGELPINLEHFNLKTLIKEVAIILEPQVKQKNISFRTVLDPSVPKILVGDTVRIRQILINLLGNALKFTEDGEVAIECHKGAFNNKTNKQTINFTISDTGIGMNVDFLKAPFEKFQQEDISISRKFGGTGLGLSITKHLTRLMKGDIHIKSTKKKGTNIQISLPLAIGHTSKMKETPTPYKQEAFKKLRVLVVEDNRINRLVVTNILAGLGAIIQVAVNGLEAIEQLKNSRFDLILMDIQMPLMNGIEATKIIRNNLQIHTPVIALSANAFKSEIKKCINAGMNDYLTKPFEEEELLQIVYKYYKPLNKQNPESTKSSLQKETSKLYDLYSLEKISRGNADFIKKMLTIFVETIPEQMKEIFKALKSENIESVQNIVHKIKPSIANLGILSIERELHTLERFTLQKKNKKELKLMIDKVNDTLNKVVSQIQKNELT